MKNIDRKSKEGWTKTQNAQSNDKPSSYKKIYLYKCMKTKSVKMFTLMTWHQCSAFSQHQKRLQTVDVERKGKNLLFYILELGDDDITTPICLHCFCCNIRKICHTLCALVLLLVCRFRKIKINRLNINSLCLMHQLCALVKEWNVYVNRALSLPIQEFFIRMLNWTEREEKTNWKKRKKKKL